jgi:hypothetical protein
MAGARSVVPRPQSEGCEFDPRGGLVHNVLHFLLYLAIAPESAEGSADKVSGCKESVGPGRETQRNAVRRSARQPHALFVYHIFYLYRFPFLRLLSLFSDFRQRRSTLPQRHDYIIESLSSVFIVTDTCDSFPILYQSLFLPI